MMLRANMVVLNSFFASYAVVSLANPANEHLVLLDFTDVSTVWREAELYALGLLNCYILHVVDQKLVQVGH